MLSLPALKKYGDVRPDFRVKDPKSRAFDESESESREAAYGLRVELGETDWTWNGSAGADAAGAAPDILCVTRVLCVGYVSVWAGVGVYEESDGGVGLDLEARGEREGRLFGRTSCGHVRERGFRGQLQPRPIAVTQVAVIPVEVQYHQTLLTAQPSHVFIWDKRYYTVQLHWHFHPPDFLLGALHLSSLPIPSYGEGGAPGFLPPGEILLQHVLNLRQAGDKMALLAAYCVRFK